MPESRARKPRASSRGDHWNSLSDEELLSRSLTTDNPEELEGLVTYVPGRHREAHVEFKYDFRRQDREKLKCVHGHHRHLSGFVMRIADERFLVGRICGKTIYGEDFGHYTQAYDNAVVRQNALFRAKKIREALDPFNHWLAKMAHSSAFPLYVALRAQWIGSLPWLYEQLRIKCLKHSGKLAIRERVRDEEAERQDDARFQRECELYKNGGAKPQPSRKPIFKDRMKELCEIPCKAFFETSESINEAVIKVCNEIFSLLPPLERALKDGKEIESLVTRLRGRLTRLEELIAEVRAIEDLFQPAMLAAIAEWADVSDNSKRSYKPGLTEITMTSRKGSCTIAIPPGYRAPDISPITQFRNALAGFSPV